ncbi:FecCD family ABC transporter permease [Glutamicibacter sp. NPDC087344]|uniref:FecCD family ABC transporter permease n=1 Tax=Glutamicibacter sp. NPDC087344 TaxID=3363994 RepID=UPI0038137E7B
MTVSELTRSAPPRISWRAPLCWVLLAAACLLLLLNALGLGADVRQWWLVATGQADSGTMFLVRELRGPRALGAVVVGVGFGIAGAITQSVLRNVLASPDIIGVTSGASLGAVTSIVGTSLFPAILLLGPWRLPLSAMLGAVLAGALVISLSYRGGISSFRLVLVGLGVNAGLGAGVSWMLLRAELPDLNSAMVWLTGSLSLATWDLLKPVALLVLLLGAILIILAARWLDILELGDDVAAALGLNVKAVSLILLGTSVVLAGATVAVAGPVGFIAFVAPQLAQRMFGTTHPTPGRAALTGAVLMLLADLLGQNVFPVLLPVGLVTSIAGAPFLVWILLLLSKKRS